MALPLQARKGLYAAAAVIGYILSPLSWWNDAVVNIPLSLAAGTILSKTLGVPLDVAVAASYTATNILGVALLALGGSGLLGASRRKIALALAASIIYSILVLAIL